MQFLEHFLQVFGITIVRYFVIAGIPFLVFYKWYSARFASDKIQQRQAPAEDARRDVVHSVITCVVFALLGAVLLYTPLVGYTQVYTDIDAWPVWWIPVSAALAMVLHDTYFYWTHRLMHHKAIFRHVHLLHHKSPNPSPWSSYSFHLLETVIEGSVLVVVAVVIPMHPIALITFVVGGFIVNVYGHLGYELMPRWFRHTIFFEIFNSSVHHNVHHSKFEGNYGLYFRIWDRLMGTEHPDYVKEYDKVQAQRFGDAKQNASHKIVPERVADNKVAG